MLVSKANTGYSKLYFFDNSIYKFVYKTPLAAKGNKDVEKNRQVVILYKQAAHTTRGALLPQSFDTLPTY